MNWVESRMEAAAGLATRHRTSRMTKVYPIDFLCESRLGKREIRSNRE